VAVDAKMEHFGGTLARIFGIDDQRGCDSKLVGNDEQAFRDEGLGTVKSARSQGHRVVSPFL